MPADWSDEELAAAVRAYRKMQFLERERKAYSKRQIYRELAERFGRTEGAFEFRMQNISAVLALSGEGWVPGLKPASHVGADVRDRIESLLRRVPQKMASGRQAPPYKDKLPAMREWLVAIARSEGKVTYGQVMGAFGIDRLSLRHALGRLGHQSGNLDEPIITALVVSKATQRCSSGFANEFGIRDDQAERRRLYSFWKQHDIDVGADAAPDDSLEVRAAKFVSVEARPEQAAFRRRVYLAYGGKCAISGCSLVCALDAAHKRGRDWRKGHNLAEDGYLLRKDLHALYDNDLLRVSQQGVVELVSAAVRQQYSQLEGVRVSAAT